MNLLGWVDATTCERTAYVRHLVRADDRAGDDRVSSTGRTLRCVGVGVGAHHIRPAPNAREGWLTAGGTERAQCTIDYTSGSGSTWCLPACLPSASPSTRPVCAPVRVALRLISPIAGDREVPPAIRSARRMFIGAFTGPIRIPPPHRAAPWRASRSRNDHRVTGPRPAERPAGETPWLAVAYPRGHVSHKYSV